MITFPYKGKELGVKEIAKLPECKAPYSTMYFRIIKRGMTVEQALAVPEKKKSEKYLWNGEMMTAFEMAKDEMARVGGSTIQKRIKKGWTIEEAVCTPSGHPPVVASTKTPESKPCKELAKIFETPVNPDKCRYTKGGWS